MIKWFIDDERFPPEDGTEWIVLRSSADAIFEMNENGMPDFISFDHDLGGEDTSMVFLHECIRRTLDGAIGWPRHFGFAVHSQNPVGARNISLLLENFLIDQEIW